MLESLSGNQNLKASYSSIHFTKSAPYAIRSIICLLQDYFRLFV